jgi:MoaA/NifB/PqqE/SkfB family radical SAM enzyme
MAPGGGTVLALDHWHIEVSSICSLRCPRCPRAEQPESLLNQQLDLEFFKQRLGADVVRGMRKVTFCGNDGDPIYCRDLADICVWMKTLNPELSIVIVTNGSHRAPHWWEYLARVLDHRDEVHFSIDGWDQHSNQQYRVNSEWDSIQRAIGTFRSINSDTYLVWATIAFAFNQFSLDHMKSLAMQGGFDLFQLTKSTKFGSKYPEVYGVNDELEPTAPGLTARSHRFERQFHALTHRPRPGSLLRPVFMQRAKDLAKQQLYSGICLIGNKGVYLNSQGEFYPCCWTANRYPHNQNWHQLAHDRFNLRHRTFAEIMQDDFWSTEFLRFESLECRTKCTRERLKDTEHTTEW